MSRNTPANPEQQLADYRSAIDALGGINPAAATLGFSTRHSARLYSGASPLHDGILRDLAQALLAHADLCRQLERRLSPAFASNLTEDQRSREGKPDGRRYDPREQADG